MLLQGWLDRNGPFDVIVDGANVGMFNQNFGEGGFNFYQVCLFILWNLIMSDVAILFCDAFAWFNFVLQVNNVILFCSMIAAELCGKRD